jgi:hypothetical protein
LGTAIEAVAPKKMSQGAWLGSRGSLARAFVVPDMVASLSIHGFFADPM